jgi:hypothetical protein
MERLSMRRRDLLGLPLPLAGGRGGLVMRSKWNLRPMTLVVYYQLVTRVGLGMLITTIISMFSSSV